MKTNTILLLVIIIVSLLCIGCNIQDSKDINTVEVIDNNIEVEEVKDVPEDKVLIDNNIVGYQYNNIENFGIVATQGDYLYYSTAKKYNSALYRMKKDGTNLEILNECSAEFINVLGDWVYYKNNSDSGKLYRTNIIDKISEVLTDDEIFYIYVGEKIYTILCDTPKCNNPYLTTMDLDGNNQIKLEFSSQISKVDNFILSRPGFLGSSKLDIINISENSKESIDLGKALSQFTYYDGFIYCILGSWNEGFEMYKVSLDGNDKMRIGDIEPLSFSILEDIIYAIIPGANNEWSIIKVDLDGTNKTTIINIKESLSLNIVDNQWIYFGEYQGRDGSSYYNNYFRVKIDGTGLEALPEIINY